MPKQKEVDMYKFTPEYRLDRIPVVLNKHNIFFSKGEAEKLLGGEMKLLRLISEGKIRVEKKTETAANSKWRCNAGDVIKYMRV